MTLISFYIRLAILDGFRFILLFLMIFYVWFVTSHVASFSYIGYGCSLQLQSNDSNEIKCAE